MVERDIVIRGASEHNLQNLDLTLPRDALVTFTGVSGSGKSSLAFDTLFREGQRRFLESLSSYARQFVGRMEKPAVESVTGLSPTISIDQKTVNRNPRSTVGTITEVYDYLRLLFARLGTPHCVQCGKELRAQTADQIVDSVLKEFPGERCLVLAPVVRDRKGHYRKELDSYRQKGFVRARVDGVVRRLDEKIELHRYRRHTIELVIDRLVLQEDRRHRLAEAVEAALKLSDGQMSVLVGTELHREFSSSLSCTACGIGLPELEPRLFSFNSPHGACPECNGLGQLRRIDPDKVIDPSLSIRGGALRVMTKTGYLPYVKLNASALESLAKQLDIDLDLPWKKLAKSKRDRLLHGSNKKVRIRFQHESKSGRMSVKGFDHRAIPGILAAMTQAWERSHPRHLEKFLSELTCEECEGGRLRAEARAVTFRGAPISEFAEETIEESARFFDELELGEQEHLIGEGILRELRSRFHFLQSVGIGYLTLARSAASLSGGEAQRVRLATQVGAGLQGVLYILDEPSIGLHARDHDRLLGTLRALRDRRNTVVVVEHDKDTMLHSDWLVDIGPGAGELGGHIVAEGSVAQVLKNPRSLTTKYLRGQEKVFQPEHRRPGNGKKIRIEGAAHFNLKNVNVDLPLGMLVGVTGVSGSGKSTLVHMILRRELARQLHQAEAIPGKHRRVKGIEHIDKVVEIDQAPIGRTPRSNPATYTGVWNHIRDLFAATPEARTRGYKKGRFSFNVKGGRCEECQGAGVRTIEMQFLADVQVPCDECSSRRFNRETLEVLFLGKTVHEILELTIAEAAKLFENFPKVSRILNTLLDVGLGYVRLGQPSTTLSGGEAQRVKLATELARPATGRTLYILDEPTTGLHFHDIRKLLETLSELVDRGNSVLVIEHNLDVILACDHLIDLGPEGGAAGGQLVATGSPEQLMKHGTSHTGRFLKESLRESQAVTSRPKRRTASVNEDPSRNGRRLSVRGARKNNLDSVEVDIPHDKLTVVTGVSGSGKTSLALDTLFAEGQRRFVESLSTYARRFFSRLDRAPVDQIAGLRPAVAIDQKNASRNPRSTVATTTEIYDYLRLLFAKTGEPHCPECDRALIAWTPSAAAGAVIKELEGEKLVVTAPLFRKGESRRLALTKPKELEACISGFRSDGFTRILVDGVEARLDGWEGWGRKQPQRIDLVLDRVRARSSVRTRLADAFEEGFRRGHGWVAVWVEGKEVRSFSSRIACDPCGYALPEELSPRHFSFNHHLGVCHDCEGFGRQRRAVEHLLIPKPHRPLLKGAMVDYPGRYFRRKSSYTGSVVRAAAESLGADLDQPWESLTPKQKRGLLRAEGLPDRFEVQMRRARSGRRREYSFQARFRGILGEVEHWLRGAAEGKWWTERLMALTEEGPCPSCQGGRLRRDALAVRVQGKAIHEVTAQTIEENRTFFGGLKLSKNQQAIAQQPLQEIQSRLGFLHDVGLSYLTLDRPSRSLSGGESQRIRLASQLGSGLVGVLYVLDEPSIGLHPRDTGQLIDTLVGLRDLGNTVVVVEHDEDMIRAADYLVDLGPGAGIHGGRVTAQGTVKQVLRNKQSLTGSYLRGTQGIAIPERRRPGEKKIELRNARLHNLKDLSIQIPLHTLTVVTGVSGSGKSTLIMDVLRPNLESALKGEESAPVACKALRGLDHVDQLVVIDQSPIGTTPSSNPATYTKVFDPIRDVFAVTPDAKMKGFQKSRFSFNQGQGRCAACQGRGALLVEMHFLSDLWVECEACRGRRYNEETLAITYKGKNISDVLQMEVGEAREFFENHPRIQRILSVLDDVGLGYLKLGQSSTTLSGGEAQRVKLAAELARSSRGHTLYLLDEPTTGLHFADVEKLVKVFHRLVERDNTVLVIEHHLDVIKNADHLVDLGPEGGAGGGQLVIAGTPEQVADHATSHTGSHLKRLPGFSSRPRRRAGASS